MNLGSRSSNGKAGSSSLNGKGLSAALIDAGRRCWRDLLATGVLLAIVVILWLPFSLNAGLFGDDWYLHALYESGYRVFHPERFATLYFSDRPLAPLVWMAGYLVFGTFVGWNLWLATVLFLKGFATYVLVNLMWENHRGFALLVAALAIVYPADLGIFNLSYAVYHFAVAMQIIAACFLVTYWKTSRSSFFILSLATVAICLAIYEGIFPLVLATPLLLLVMDGLKITRRWVYVSAIWYVLPILKVGFFLRDFFGDKLAFQSSILTPGNPLRPSIVWDTLVFAYGTHFYGGFRTAIEQSASILQGREGNLLYLWLAAAGAILTASCALLFWRSGEAWADKCTPRKWALIVLIGLLGLYAGYVMYVPTTSRMGDRVLLQSAPYAALAAVGFIWLAISWRPARIKARGGVHLVQATLRFCIPAILIFLGLVFCLMQHRLFVKHSEERAEPAMPVAELAHRIKPDTVLILFDKTSDSAVAAYGLQNREMESVIKILFADPSLVVRICRSDHPHFECQVTAEGIRTAGEYNRSSPQLKELHPFNRVVGFEYQDHEMQLLDAILSDEGEGNAPAYKPRERIDPAAPLPSRVSMFDYLPRERRWRPIPVSTQQGRH